MDNNVLILQMELEIESNKWNDTVKEIRERLSKQTNREVIILPKGTRILEQQ